MDKKILVTQTSLPPFDEYVEMLKPLWETHWVTNMGKFHKELEESLNTYLGTKRVSLMTNGHMALEMAIQSMGFPEGSEVITTPFTFISTTHAIVRNKLQPVFCDIKEDDYTIDENKIEELITEKTVAIVPVHVYGNICNVEKIEEIAYKYNLKVIYDAAHAFGEYYKDKPVGIFGDMSAFSFHATKVFNTIEGGAVCCNTEEQYEKLYNLKNFGIRSQETVVSVGANAKMDELRAIMGLCNLRYIDENIGKRRKKVEKYYEELSDIKGIRLNHYNKNIKPNYAYMPVLFADNEIRDRVKEGLEKENIFSRKYFYPITADSYCFKNKYKFASLDIARNISERILVIPLYADLDEDDINRIADNIKGLVE